MKKSNEVMKEAIEKVGAKMIASKLGLSTSLVYKWCQESMDDDPNAIPSGAQNPLDRFKKVYLETQDLELVYWVCQLADGYFVKNMESDKNLVDANILKNIQVFIKEFSEALDAISASYNKGKRITIKESEKIRKEWDDLKRVGEGFVKACESGKFNKKD